MDISNTQRIEAPRAVVWAALNDPEVLKQCIPGCESLEKVSDTEMRAKVTLRIGPVKTSFTGKVTLTDIVPLEGYTIIGEGSGGGAGFAKGTAKIRLTDDGPATLLSYDAKAEIGGKLAQLGSRLIDSTVKKLSGDFFRSFGEVVAPQAAGAPAAAATAGKSKQGWFSRWFGWLFRKKS
jgi:carbon monoxide dehydrogenase subunit G